MPLCCFCAADLREMLSEQVLDCGGCMALVIEAGGIR
jgi:hypothetical protein